MGFTVMVTPHPAICWTSFCRNRRIPTRALDQPLLAPWDQVQDPAQAAMAVVPQLVELPEAEQVTGIILRLFLYTE